MEPDEIKELADKIKKAVDQLRNTDAIIDETRDDLRKVNKLEEDAIDAKSNATTILTNASAINDVLNLTGKAQKGAQHAIDNALTDIQKVEELLNLVSQQ